MTAIVGGLRELGSFRKKRIEACTLRFAIWL